MDHTQPTIPTGKQRRHRHTQGHQRRFNFNLGKFLMVSILVLVVVALGYFRGNVIVFSITNPSEVQLAQQSYESFHQAANDAFANRMRTGIISPLPDEAKK